MRVSTLGLWLWDGERAYHRKDSGGNRMQFGVRERMEARTPKGPNDKFMEKGKAALSGLGSGLGSGYRS